MATQKKHSILPILGLDPSQPAEYISDRATPNCENISIDLCTIQKRLGSVQISASTGERILAYRELYLSGSYHLLLIGITKVYSMNYATGEWTDRTSSALTANVNYRVDTALPIASGNRILVYTNGKDAIRRWNGGDTDDQVLGGTPPLAKYCIDYGTYLVLGNVTSTGTNYPMRIQWSDVGAPETWTGGNSGHMDLSEDGNDITGLSIYGNYLCVHKESAIYLGYLIDSTNIFSFDRKNTGVGTICFATIQNLPTGEQIFLARDGIHLFNGISAPIISAPIMNELRESINPEYIHKCWSVVVEDKNEYWVGIPTGDQTEAETVYKYNYALGVCHKDKRTGMSAAGKFTANLQLAWSDQVGTWEQATGNWDDIAITKLFKTIVLGTYLGVSHKRTDVTNDISTAISSFWESKDYQCEDIGRICRWQKLQLWAKGNSVKVEYSTNSGSTWSTIKDVTLSSYYPSDSSPLTLYFDSVSTKIRFRFSNNKLSEQFTLKQFIIWYSEREVAE